MDDFTCDLNCPFEMENGVWCCQNCNERRKDCVNEINKDKWSDEFGFCSSTGCRLERDEMPSDCRRYNCKDYGFDVWRLQWRIKKFNGTEWVHSKTVVEHGSGDIKTSVAYAK